MRLTVLGSGDAFGSGGRFNASFLIEAAESKLLLDCGASTLVALNTRSVDPSLIDGIVLSHLHGDHFGGLPFLLLEAQHLSHRQRPLLIAGPPGTKARLDAALDVLFPRSRENSWRFDWRVIELAVGEAHHLLGTTITTAEVLHQSGAPSTAVRLIDGSATLAYSGDTEWTDALVPIADGADLFIVECYNYDRQVTGHMAWTILRQKLDILRAKAIMITHMNPTMLAHIAEAQARGVLVAHDGMQFDIGQAGATDFAR